jgi:trans-2-enoyl-CoA reductase
VAGKKVLVIETSTGFGLASRISSALDLMLQPIGVFFETAYRRKNSLQVGIIQLLSKKSRKFIR